MRIVLIGCWAGATQLAMLPVTVAQIRYVTVPTPRNPVPTTGLIIPTLPTTSARPTISPMPARPQPVLNPALDKAEVQKRVVAFQKQRAAEGSASAQYELGLRYLKGDGVVKDPAAARSWLIRAADAGSSEARRKLTDLAGP